MKHLGRPLSILLCLIVTTTSGCVRTDEGTAISEEAAEAAASVATSTQRSADDSGPAAPGVLATARAPIPSDAVTCAQPAMPVPHTTVLVADPQAPRITVALPDGWSVTQGSGDVGARMSGPDGMSATVTVAQTRLEPAEAFTEYADKAMAVSSVSSISVLPAELCGYSGQKLMGTWSDNPQQSVEFLDRIVHVWTESNSYLVAVHVQAPAGTAGFDQAAAVLAGDFAVEIP
jgi:hypothetical protein